MHSLKIENDEFDGYSFIFYDMKSGEELFSSEIFAGYEECLDAAKKHKLYADSELKFDPVSKYEKR